MKQTNNLSNNTKEKDKRYKKPVEGKQLQEQRFVRHVDQKNI